MPGRWEGDDRGRGVADAPQLLPGVSELAAAFRESDWVAESPETHLRHHIEEWCRRDGRLALVAGRTDSTGAYVLDLAWRGEPVGVGHARAAVFCLLGTFAESATYVRQRRVASSDDSAETLRFEVGTGELASDAAFDPHGHVAVINIAGVS